MRKNTSVNGFHGWYLGELYVCVRSSVSLYIMVSVVAGVPLLLAIFLAVQHTINLNTQSHQALKDQQLVTLITHYDNLAHNLAVERGLTAGVLGSQGKTEIVQKLTQQRKSR